MKEKRNILPGPETYLSIIVDDDPSVDIENDHSDDGHDGKAVGDIPVQDETIEVPPLLRGLGGLRGFLQQLVSLGGLVDGVGNPRVHHADDDGGEN